MDQKENHTTGTFDLKTSTHQTEDLFFCFQLNLFPGKVTSKI